MPTLIVVGREEETAALAAGQWGTMGMPTADVHQYISAYGKGPKAHEQFLASLIPTHP
jgi:hypothetical protein